MADIKDTLRQLRPSGRITLTHQHPARVENEYRKALRGVIIDLAKQINAEIKPLLTQNLDARTDGLGDVLRALKNLVVRGLSPESLAQRIARETVRAVDGDMGRAVERAVGVNILPEGEPLSDLLDGWIEENTLLITDMRDTHLKRVQSVISKGFREGISSRDIARQINEQTGIGLRRAKLIARDQVGTLNGLVTKRRDEELGVEKFVWRTVNDERVRGKPGGLYPSARPSHWAREGKEYTWRDGARGEFPGTPVNCRCFAEAVISWDD